MSLTLDNFTKTVDTLQFGFKLDNSDGIYEEKSVNRLQIEVKQILSHVLVALDAGLAR
jgi:hypothetical protein